MKQYKSAFSFVELIIVLILLFVMLASMMPLITRKHLTPPEKVNHGTYACYRHSDNTLHQTLIKGTKVVENDIAVAKCTFEPPKKAKYFYVQLIGGGGGGKHLDISSANPYSYSAYRIQNVQNNQKGNIATGCYKLWSDGDANCYSSTTSTKYNTDIFNNEQEYLDLVKNYKISLYASGRRGRYCNPNYSESHYAYGIKCDNGRKDAEAVCKADRYDGTTSSTCHYSGHCHSSGGKYYYQMECPSLVGTDCPSCKNYDFAENNCDPETHTGAGCFKEVKAMVAEDCYNTRYGAEKIFYTHVPLKYLYKTHISSSAYRDDENRYVTYNGEQIKKAWNGVGMNFTWKTADGVDQYFKVRGGSGAIKGLMQKNNPYYAADSVQRTNGIQYCSPDNTYTTLQPASSSYDPDKLYDAYCMSSNSSLYPCKATTSESYGYNTTDAFNFQNLQIGDIDLSQKQAIPYGVGGKAGQIKTLIFKELKEDLPMNPGKGGAPGYKGEDTTFGGGDSGIPQKIAYGGPAGDQVYTMDVKIDPYMSDGSYQWTQPAGQWRTATTKSIVSRNGDTVSYNSYIKFIISYRNENIINIMKDFGKGGNGAATMTDCTFGYRYEPVTLERNSGTLINSIVPAGRENVPPSKLTSSGFKCNGKYTWYTSGSNYGDTGGYSTGYWRTSSGYNNTSVKIDEPATDGGSGAVVISW